MISRSPEGDRERPRTVRLDCMIIDDEQPARDELAYLLSSHDDIRVVGEADSVSTAVQGICRHRPDFIFLDIQMPGKNGFDLLSQIRKMDRPPLVVFITAYDQYAVKAFDAHAVDYIMKPFAPARLQLSLVRVRELIRMRQGPAERQAPGGTEMQIKKVPVCHRGRIRLLDPDQIVFCRYLDKSILIHTETDSFPLQGSYTMDHLAALLGSEQFFRTHRNTVVNLDKIEELSPWFHGKYIVKMQDKHATELTVTRDRARQFKQLLGI